MAERHGSASRVHPGRVETELASDSKSLRRKRLVQFEEIDIRERQPGTLHGFSHGNDGPYPHHHGLDSRGGERDDMCQRCSSQLACASGRGDDERGCAVVDPRRIPGGDAPAFFERGPQRRKRLDRRVSTRMLVDLESR
jgi:hypothetical protein